MTEFDQFDSSKQPKCKVELHVHLDGAVRLTTIWELAQKKGIQTSAETLEDLFDICCTKRPSSLAHFLKPFKLIGSVIAGDAEAIERIACEFCEDAVKEDLLYVEVRYCPHLLSSASGSPDPPLSARDVVVLVNRGLAKGCEGTDLTVRTILSCFRSRPEWSQEILDLCVEFRNDGVVGIDIAGDEALYLASEAEIRAFEGARALGIHRTVHAGEAGPAANVKAALEVLHAERIGHGYHVVDDLDVYNFARRQNVHFEVCPHSSNLTNSVPRGCLKHPITRFAEDNVNFSISRDDPALIQKSLDEEYDFLRGFGFKDVHITRANFAAVQSCFLPAKEKKELFQKILKIYGIYGENISVNIPE